MSIYIQYVSRYNRALDYVFTLNILTQNVHGKRTIMNIVEDYYQRRYSDINWMDHFNKYGKLRL